MRTKEVRIVTIYNIDDLDTSWDYVHVIANPDTAEIIVTAKQMPLDYEKNITSIYTLLVVDEDDKPIFDENGRVTLIKKTMNLRNVLAFYCPSNEIKQRLKNGQIKINNVPVKSLDVECDFDYDNVKQIDLPDFLMDSGLDLHQLTVLRTYGDFNIMDLFGSPTLEEGPTNIPQFEFLRGYVLLSISKREHYVYVNNELKNDIPYSITDIKT